jgi:hypothetical protein
MHTTSSATSCCIIGTHGKHQAGHHSARCSCTLGLAGKMQASPHPLCRLQDVTWLAARQWLIVSLTESGTCILVQCLHAQQQLVCITTALQVHLQSACPARFLALGGKAAVRYICCTNSNVHRYQCCNHSHGRGHITPCVH